MTHSNTRARSSAPPSAPTVRSKRSGWDHALVAYRPFLSYNELGSMLEGRPSELHDAMSSILGLEDVDAAVKALGDAKRLRARKRRDAKDALQPLLTKLAEADDDRAVRCHASLSGRTWDLDTVDEVLLTDEIDAEVGGVLTTLRGLASLDCSSDEQVEKAATELLAAQAAVDDLAGTDADRADALARVLTAALHAHEAHGDRTARSAGPVDSIRHGTPPRRTRPRVFGGRRATPGWRTPGCSRRSPPRRGWLAIPHRCSSKANRPGSRRSPPYRLAAVPGTARRCRRHRRPPGAHARAAARGGGRSAICGVRRARPSQCRVGADRPRTQPLVG